MTEAQPAPSTDSEVLTMTVTLHNIEGKGAPVGFSHASAARGNLIVHVAGQVGENDEGVIAEGLTAQAEQALRNVARAFDAAGAAVTDLVKTTRYVVGWDPSQFEALVTGLMTAQVDHPFPDAPSPSSACRPCSTPPT